MSLNFAYIDQAWNTGTGSSSNRANVKGSRESRKKKASAGTCAGANKSYNKVYDDVIDAYLDDSPTVRPGSYNAADTDNIGRSYDITDSMYNKDIPSNELARPPKPQPCYTGVEASDTGIYENSLEYARFFSNDNMFQRKYQQQSNLTDAQCEEEILEQEMLPQEEESIHYSNQESSHDYQPSYQYMTPNFMPNNSFHQWMELALFVIGGIILIFIMEQFVQLGVNLR
jgi:hypothetical protein